MEMQYIEPLMTKFQLIRTIIGLVIIDAMFTFGFKYWRDHDPRIAGPFLYWFIIPLVSILAAGMAFLQLYFYKHPEQDEE